MYIGVIAVKPLAGYKLLLTFENGEQGVFEMAPYLDIGIFAELRDDALFRSVRVNFDTVEWSNGADICPEILHNNSRKLPTRDEVAQSEQV